MEQVNALEVLRESMHIEKEGIKFYKKAAKVSKDKKTRDVFLKLAQDELNHLEKLELTYDYLAENSEWLVDKDLLEAKPRVMEATEVFDQDISTDEDLDELGAIEQGITAEEDSIRLYKKAFEEFKTEDKRGASIFKWLLDFEKSHLRLLKERRRAIVGSD